MILLQLLVSLLRCIQTNNPGMGIKKNFLWYACLITGENQKICLCRGTNFVNVALRSFVNAHQTCQALFDYLVLHEEALFRLPSLPT